MNTDLLQLRRAYRAETALVSDKNKHSYLIESSVTKHAPAYIHRARTQCRKNLFASFEIAQAVHLDSL